MAIRNVSGTAASGFEGVRDAFALAQAADQGAAQLAVYVHGRCVVDVWAGQDPIGRRPVDRNSLAVLMSITKSLSALCAHLLRQRGKLDLDAPVCRYWPEFAARDKADVTVAQLLSHQAGLSNFVPPRRVAELYDWNDSVQALAAMAPLWEPGTAFQYHTLTFGYLVGEVVRRITGRSIGEFFAREVAEPLGLDLWIGLPEEHEHRVLPTVATNPGPSRGELQEVLTGLGVDLTDPAVAALVGNHLSPAELAAATNSRAGHAAELPAVNAIGNARSVARLYAAMIGSVDGIRLLTPESVELARCPATDGLPSAPPFDRVALAHPLRFALGFELSRSGEPQFGPGSFGHAGAGGRLAYAHPETGLAVGYVCTSMSWNAEAGPDTRWVPWTAALHEALAS